ncbi:hypothetical protein [Ruegeria sp.]|uniref:hypothetical protein n=1 Tax=Ruegeria sp. TaxID=1879320 RepID=UPI003C7B9D44
MPAKAITSAFRGLHTLPERIVRSGTSLILACLVSFGSLAAAEEPNKESEKAFLAAAKLCSSGFENLDSARDALTKAGWNEFEDGPAPAVVSNRVAFSIDETDLPYTVENAYFMAASMLGNSALGPNQPAFVHTDVQLALIGVEEGHQYCAFAGPRWTVYSAIKNGFAGGIRARTNIVSLIIGREDNATIAIALIDLDAFFQALGTTETDSSKKRLFGATFKELLMPANITISPDYKGEHGEAN